MANWDRRTFLRVSSVGVLATTLGCDGDSTKDSATPSDSDTGADAGNDTADTDDTDDTDDCAETKDDIEGPYYREDPPVRDDLDQYSEDGQSMFLTGQVKDEDCQPIAGARIDFWHADTAGAYDLSTAEMRYYGQTTTDDDGWYSLTTLVPGRYLNGDQYRPAHIHVKVWVNGEVRLTTQLYFEGDKFNDVDPWASEELTVSYTEKGGQLVGSFTFTV